MAEAIKQKGEYACGWTLCQKTETRTFRPFCVCLVFDVPIQWWQAMACVPPRGC